MDYFTAAINACFKLFSGAPRVYQAIDQAKALVALGNLDEAIGCLRATELANRSDSTGGIISEYLDPLIDAKTVEVRNLMASGEHGQVRALFNKAPVFYGEMSDVVRFLGEHPVARAGAGAS